MIYSWENLTTEVSKHSSWALGYFSWLWPQAKLGAKNIHGKGGGREFFNKKKTNISQNNIQESLAGHYFFLKKEAQKHISFLVCLLLALLWLIVSFAVYQYANYENSVVTYLAACVPARVPRNMSNWIQAEKCKPCLPRRTSHKGWERKKGGGRS